MQPYLTPTFEETIRNTFGAEGDRWLANLAALLDEYSVRWQLELLPPPWELSYNYVVPARRTDGSNAVLKLGVPNEERTSETAALRVYAGRGCAALLEADAEHGAILLEQLEPGDTLAPMAEENDARATSIAAAVMRELWQPVPDSHEFISVAKWGQGFQRLHAAFEDGYGPFPAYLVDAAERLFADLVASMAEAVVLHGDLHHYNILRAQRQPWLAIDPKGVTGEAVYEVGALLRNPYPYAVSWPNLKQVQGRRVDQLADELGFDRQRIVGWAIAQAVLAGWWTYEDNAPHGGDPTPWLHLATVFSSLAGA